MKRQKELSAGFLILILMIWRILRRTFDEVRLKAVSPLMLVSAAMWQQLERWMLTQNFFLCILLFYIYHTYIYSVLTARIIFPNGFCHYCEELANGDDDYIPS